MLDGNQDSSKPKKSESPPQLKKPRTLITTSDDAGPTIFPGPLLPAVRKISTVPPSLQWPPPDRRVNAPADYRDFSERDWVFPSNVLRQTRSANAKLLDASHRIASQPRPPPDASAPKPEAERKKLKVVPSGASVSSASELTRSSSRRPRELNRSLLLVMVSHFTWKTVY